MKNDSHDGKYNIVTEGCTTWGRREVQHGSIFHFLYFLLDNPYLYILMEQEPKSNRW
jgi:hypothetical protein